jgi:hypothetical protein
MLLQKLIIPPLVPKFHEFRRIRELITHESPPMGPTLSQINPVHTLASYFFHIYFNISFLSTLYLLNDLIPSAKFYELKFSMHRFHIYL